MAAIPAMSVQAISPGEMQLLLSRAGLILNPGQVADLVLAWRQVEGLIGSIRHDRPLADDMALTFRLPPPPTSAPSAVTPATEDQRSHDLDVQRERCLLFVACTRARENLMISWSGEPSSLLPV